MRKSVAINRTRKTVRIRVPASRTNLRNRSVIREWGCVCPPEGSAAGCHYSSVPPCPYCAAVTQSEIVSAVARENGMDAEDVPFFPTASGNAANKDQGAASVEQITSAGGDTVRDESGRRKITGHTFLGARRPVPGCHGPLAVQIQLLAHWASPIIIRYAAASPLQAVTGDVRRFANKPVGRRDQRSEEPA